MSDALVRRTEVYEVQSRGEHFRKKVRKEDIRAGPREWTGERWHWADIADEMENQPEAGRDRAGPKAPRRGRGVFVNAIQPVDG